MLDSQMAKGLDMKKLAQIMDSPAGKAMMRQMSGKGGDKLRQKAAGAAEGDASAISGMFSDLMSTAEGQALVEQIKGMKK